jgi:hypothetical protein
MLIVYGTYRRAPRLVAYRNDWCNHCDEPVLAQQWRSFYLGHLFWIPILPLFFHKAWRCKACGNNPRHCLRTSLGLIVAGLILCSLVFVIMLFGPNTGEGAGMIWVMRFAFGGLAVLLALWLKSRLKELPPERHVEPPRNDRCLVCDGRMTDFPQWHCVDCGVMRYGDKWT